MLGVGGDVSARKGSCKAKPSDWLTSVPQDLRDRSREGSQLICLWPYSSCGMHIPHHIYIFLHIYMCVCVCILLKNIKSGVEV